MVRCDICGMDELLPFKCGYCGGTFCPEHRIPEKHSCTGIRLVKSPTERRRTEIFERISIPPAPVRMFEKREIYHLLAATAIISIAGLSLFIFSTGSPSTLAIAVAGLTLSFLAHELAHKFWALIRGLNASFRIYPLGAILTMVTAIPLIPIKFIAPGFVHVNGLMSLREMGRIALAGPLTNILISTGLYTSYLLGFNILAYRLAELNAYLAFFNLLPLGPLDGAKVIQWSKIIWLTAFLVSILLLTLPRLL